LDRFADFDANRAGGSFRKGCVLMKSILICPDERPEVPLLSAETPLVMAPALGHGVLEYWMSHVACAGAKEVVLLAQDRPEEVRKAVGNGARWGLAVEVIAASRELTPELAAEQYGAAASVMDHFPGLPDYPLFASYDRWYKALEVWMPRARTPDRVGVRELRPGVWVGLHGHIASSARLEAPCWLGDHVFVGPGAVIGPETILENGSFIEAEAEIKGSIIGPSTFVGRYMRISNSLAWGSTLVDWSTGAEATVSDDFLLCALHPRHSGTKPVPLLGRVAEWLALWKEGQAMEPQPILVKKGS
jgi:NDP-sugar pyrophosphorylase family protein